jgi:protein disulfide-isomerase
MKTMLHTLAVLAISAGISLAAQAPWTSDYEAAKARAKAENKPIFTYFTGSDWCGWCIKMEKQVLTKQEFLDYAKEHLVLLELDYPRKPENKQKQSAELQAQNKKLDGIFKIEGFPTVYLLDAEGEKLADGEDFALPKYLEEGPAKYVEHLKAALAAKAAP